MLRRGSLVGRCAGVRAGGGGGRRAAGRGAGGAAAPPGRAAGGIFRTSEGEGSHGCPSPPFILGALPSPSGSGEAFLFMLRGCFPLSVEEEEEEEEAGLTQHTTHKHCSVLLRSE